ncbi:MAG: hypothetical protein HY810_05055 [Candidatus Omnitrophica bacterium]|nr:hypothetical protein [Candidatus Omnitrophota bacterium]
MKKKVLKKISSNKLKIFKIANRRGFAAICLNNLTEGSSAYQAYQRMAKALKRGGCELPVVEADKIKRFVTANI